jgi:catechol 2,3-dioxygenase-like lactoylglutathione lyase family enzyme
MIAGGNATVYVSNMDDAVRFYTEALGLKLTNRFGNNGATVQAGTTLVVGLHPWSAKYPRPGTRGAVQLGFFLSHGDSIGALAARLRQHGVAVGGIIASAEANYIHIEDPDGTPIYIGDRDPGVDPSPEAAAGASRPEQV